MYMIATDPWMAFPRAICREQPTRGLQHCLSSCLDFSIFHLILHNFVKARLPSQIYACKLSRINRKSIVLLFFVLNHALMENFAQRNTSNSTRA